MRILLVVLVKEDLPAPVQFFNGIDFGDPDFGDKPVHDLVELFDFAFTFTPPRLSPEQLYAKPGTALYKLG